MFVDRGGANRLPHEAYGASPSQRGVRPSPQEDPPRAGCAGWLSRRMWKRGATCEMGDIA